jgi:SpoVK/Ycf46/Vps4 family AAA+-type ATPase
VTSPPQGETAGTLDLHRVLGPVVACGAPGTLRPDALRPVLPVPPGRIGVADRRAAWRAALPEASDHAPQLAARHPLDPALTAQVALDVRSRPQLSGEPRTSSGPEPADVAAAIRARAGAALPAGIELVRPDAGWQRLVLEPVAAQQVRDAVARLEHQSLVLDDWGIREAARADRGIRLLFTGPPGTGKSLAAEVLATAAGTDLLVVDVSRVVSKWIGETEKNLAAAFDVAERTQAVLFLDEADALFGARTEISDAHDRYANLETAYLLQRLDHFDGLAVLATNLDQNIDPAFLRRMDYVVEFTMPDERRRRQLWELHLPARLRADDVDTIVLAQLYPVPGAWIRNAAISAAFAAASSGGRIRQDQLVEAVQREYGKARRPLPVLPAGRLAEARDQQAARALETAAAQRRTKETA